MTNEYETQLHDVISKVATHSVELAELQKSMQQVSSYPDSMQIEYSPVLQTKTFENAPFLRYLESRGQVFDNASALVGFYEEKRENNDVQWIDELEDIPSANAESFVEVKDKMKTIVAPIEASMMAQMGNKQFNILARRLEKKFIDVNTLTDKSILEGTGTASSKDFKGLSEGIKSHNIDLAGEKISESVIDDMLEDLNNDNSHPDVIVCSYGVAKQLKALVAPYRRFNDKIDIGLGHRVISYESMLGTDIPILVDRNYDTTEGDKLQIIDSSTCELRRLMPPTHIQNLPVDKLATKQVVAAFLTFLLNGEFKNGQITGIGDDSGDSESFDVAITVKDGNGDAVSGASISIGGKTGTSTATSVTISDVPEGNRRLTVKKSGYNDYIKNVTVDKDISLNVVLESSS